MELTRIDTIVQFTPGTTSAWNNVNVAVPAGAVVIDTVNKIIKEGDGTTLFASLPVCLDYNFNSASSGAVSLEGDDVGTFAICDDGLYSPSTIQLTDILNSVITKNTKSAAQQGRINSLTLENVVAEISEGAIDGTLIICENGKYTASNRTLAQLISDLVATANAINSTMHIDDLEWYSDSELKNRVVTPNEVTEQNTFWCKVTGFHDTAELRTVDFGLATTTPNITITTTNEEETCAIIATVYGGAGNDFIHANKSAIDSKDNIFIVGYTTSEGVANGDALIVKYDSNLNILAKKRFGGANGATFTSIAIDSNDNVIAAGYSDIGTPYSGAYGIIVKFDINLNILAKKRYGGTNDEKFFDVDVDHNNNVFVCGYSPADTTLYSGLILKLDNNLNIITKKIITTTGYYHELWTMTIDSLNNVYCYDYMHNTVDSTSSNICIVKFDNGLNILISKVYGGTSTDYITSMAVDSTNNVYCVGYTASQNTPNLQALIIKLDSNLNILMSKVYNTVGTAIGKVLIKDDIIYCSSNIAAEDSFGNADTTIIKFDTNLDILAKKRFGGTGNVSVGILINSLNDIIVAGYTTSEGSGSNDALVIKIPASIPPGSFVGSLLTRIVINDVDISTFSNTTALTLSSITLTPMVSSLVITDITALTLTNSSLTAEREVIVAARYTTPTKLITTIYTSNDSDRFTAATVDSLGNIIAVGQTTIAGTANAIIVKFDADFVTIARKIYAGNYSEFFNSVITDSANNIIAVGNYTTNEGGLNEAFIVKFDPTLTSIMIHKTYGATGDDAFNDVTIDPSGNIIVVGYTTSEGSGLKDGLVIKFNTNLTISAKKRYGGSGNDVLVSISMDAVGNAICAGWTSSEGTNTSGLILKLDTNLNIVLRKIYNSTLGTTTEFASVSVTSANVIYCCGRVIMAASNRGLICKFDSNLNITANKLYGNTIGNTEFTGLSKDSAGNIFCVGKTNAEGAGNYDALVVKFSGTLGILGRKTYGTVGMDADIDCCMSGDDIVMSGYSVINGSTDAVITKMPGSLPEGIYTNKYFTDLILSDSKLTLSDDVGVVSNSTLAMLDSALTLTNGSMVLSNASGAIVTDKTIMDAVSNVFKVEIGNILDAETVVTPVFNVVTHDGDKQVTKDISVNVTSYSLITAIYGGTGTDSIQDITCDSTGNIYAVGHTTSEGLGLQEALIIKYDSSLNILAKKRYGGTGNDVFLAVAHDSSNNIYAVGYTFSETAGTGNFNALIVKFDSNLNILAKKRYGGTLGEAFYGITVDSSNNIYAVGYTQSGIGSGCNVCLVTKFDINLNIIINKRYGVTTAIVNDSNFEDAIVDSVGNVYVVGYSSLEGAGVHDALIVKFDSNLNILAKKRYGGTGEEYFVSITVDASDNVYAVGSTTSESLGGVEALIVKFDSNLNTLAKKRYGGTGNDHFWAISIDSNNDIYVVGGTLSESINNYDALIIKFDSNLNILFEKIYSGTGGDYTQALYIDMLNNILLGGYTTSEGSGGIDILVVKISTKVPAGSVVGSVFTNLTFKDVTNLTISDSNLILSDITTLTLANSALTLATITTLTLVDSALTARREVIVS